MKPVALSLKGLHSFREMQHVDFVRLCEGGVFGIFGPTGSGKSTLLDAVTLALYGKVERAANNTQGILNHAENELFVSFCFELGDGESRRRYRVERSFKRAEGYGVRTAMCRLVEETPQGTVVLADKAAAVNEQVEALLGLTHDDFTRAVVLPQGKFAEFLTLKGAERRVMLQRIFNLEQYGDALREKLNRRTQAAEARLQAIEAEQAGLGDASAEAVQAAEEHVKAAEAQLSQAQRRLAELEQALEEARRRWEWQQEQQKLQRQLKQLEEQEAEIARLETLVARSEAAQRLLPYAEAVLQAREDVRKGEQQWNQAVQAVQQAEAQQAAAEAAYQAAQARRAAQEPALVARLEQLNRARHLAERIAQMERELAALARQQSEAAQARTAAERRRGELERLLQALDKQQQHRKAELAAREVPSAERQRILHAYRDKGDLDHWAQRLKEEREELEKKRQERDHWRQQKAAVERHGHQARKAGAAWLAVMREGLAVVDEVQEQLARRLAALETRRNERQAELEAVMRHRMAHLLAQQLRSGQPCPVCGSTEHPAPAPSRASDEAVQPLEQELDLLQQRMKAGETVRLQLTDVHWQLRSWADRLAAELKALAGGEQDVENDGPPALELGPRSGAAMRELAAAREDMERFDDGEDFLQKAQALAGQLKRQLADWEKQAETVIQHLREAGRRHEDVIVRLDHAEAECRKQNDKVAALERTLEEKTRAWQTAYPDYTLADIEARHARLDMLEREAEALRQALEQASQERDRRMRELEEVKQTEHRLAIAWTALDGQIQEKRRNRETLQAELAAMTGGQDPETLFRQVEEQLHCLKQQEQDAARAREAAAARYQEASRQAAAARQSLGEAQERLRAAETHWVGQVRWLREAASDKGWSDLERPEGVRAALLSPEDMTRHQRRIQAHRDAKKQVAARLQEVEAHLDGKRLTPEAWEAIQRRHQDAQAAVRQWSEARGAAVEAWKTLQEKHRRFVELEEQKQAWASLHEKYARLQHVFRGNAFVEFMAEEHLIRISRDASQRLKSLTRGRYALEVDSGGGFLIRDDANGGIKRPVSSLSGGETFLTSLALALALSASIQLRGRYPLQFFFLDEGFGTLDHELLDTVVTALERLQGSHMAIGVISHVPELQARLPRRLIVEPAEPGGRGSRVRLEVL